MFVSSSFEISTDILSNWSSSMNNSDLADLISRTFPIIRQHIDAIVYIDQLVPSSVRFCTDKCLPRIVILNTASSNSNNLGHFLLLVIDTDNNFILFDSFAIPYRKRRLVNLNNFVRLYTQTRNILVNKTDVQCQTTLTCSSYVLFVAYYLCRGIDYSRILQLFSPEKCSVNERLVRNWMLHQECTRRLPMSTRQRRRLSRTMTLC